MKAKFLLIMMVFAVFGCKYEFDKTSLNGVPSSKTFQLDNVDNISFANDNGLLISGPSVGKYTLIKTDKHLTIEWIKNNYDWGNLVFGSGWGSSFYSINMVKAFQRNDGSYVCVGSITEGGDVVWSSTLVTVLNQRGEQIHSYKFENMSTSNVLRTNDEGYILFGHGATLKLDKNFNRQWTKNFGDNKYSPIQIVSTSNGGFAITGTYNGYQQVFLKTFDSNGNELLGKTYKHNEYPSLEGGNDIVQQKDNGFLIVGRAGRTSPQITDCQVIRTNEIGDTLWTRRFVYPTFSWFDRIILSETNSFIIEGTIGFPNENQESILMRINENGQVLDSLTLNKFQMIIHSPLGFHIIITKKDSGHSNLTAMDTNDLFKKP